MEKLLDSTSYAKANHSHPSNNLTGDHTHSEYLEKSPFSRSTHYNFADKNHSHDYDYASSNHSHGSGW